MSTSFALNRKANQIAQTNPELAAELRMLAYTGPVAKRAAQKEVAPVTVISRTALFSKANSIAQAKPKTASALRFQAAYA
jgi:hypothetical protein